MSASAAEPCSAASVPARCNTRRTCSSGADDRGSARACQRYLFHSPPMSTATSTTTMSTSTLVKIASKSSIAKSIRATPSVRSRGGKRLICVSRPAGRARKLAGERESAADRGDRANVSEVRAWPRSRPCYAGRINGRRKHERPVGRSTRSPASEDSSFERCAPGIGGRRKAWPRPIRQVPGLGSSHLRRLCMARNVEDVPPAVTDAAARFPGREQPRPPPFGVSRS